MPSFFTEIGDSTTSEHYKITQDLDTLMNVKTNPGPTVMLLDMITITTTQQGQLPLSSKTFDLIQESGIYQRPSQFTTHLVW